MNWLYIKLSLLYFTYFSLLGVMVPYLGLYLDDRNFNLLEISQLLSLLMITKVLAPFVWGSLSDRYSNNVFLVRLGSFLTLLCYIGFFLVDSFWGFALVIILFSFFWNAVLPQIEVVTLYNLGIREDLYGRIRLWGSVGFIISVVGFGVFFNSLGIAYFPFVLLFVISLIFLSSLFHFDEPKRAKKEGQGFDKFLAYLLLPDVRNFFVVCFLLQVSHGAYYTYFSIYLESLGYTTAEIGGLWSLGVIAEVVLFIYMHRWMANHTIKLIMVVSLLLTSLRWLVSAWCADNMVLIVIAQCLHAFSFGAMHASAIKFVHQTFTVTYQGRAQALYSSLGFGAGGAVGAYASGVLVTYSGYNDLFVVSALVSFVAIFLVLPMASEKSKI